MSSEIENNDVKMEKCVCCHYYFPKDEIEKHSFECVGIDSRVECPLCNCDYPLDEVEEHVQDCIGLSNMICFICEFSRKKYSHNSIRKLLTELKSYEPDSNLTARSLLRTINEDKFDINKWISFDKDSTIECPVCLSDVPFDDIFVLACNDSHKLCYDCLYHHCLVKLNNNAPLTCPIEKCNQIIHLNELRSLPFPKHVVKKLVEKYDKQLFNGYVQNTNGAIKCPNSDCDWVAIFDVIEKIKIKCAKCCLEFCSICRGKYHYGVNCDQLPNLTQEWVSWCTNGRQIRLKNIKNYQNNKKLKEHNDFLLKNFEQLNQDEEYKVKKCRLCPKCNRIIEKIDGCDAMVCGHNYHGGDIQNGCGSKFNWVDAKPYVKKIDKIPKFEKINNKVNKIELFDHYPFKCDKCHEGIIGIRFECIHCESTSFCEKCEIEATLEHDHDHVFHLIFKSQENIPISSRFENEFDYRLYDFSEIDSLYDQVPSIKQSKRNFTTLKRNEDDQRNISSTCQIL